MSGPLTANFPAVAMLVRKDNKLLFVLRSNTGFMDGFYCLPGGRVEPGEAIRAAARREAEEEVGIVVQPEHAKHVYTQQRYKTPEDIWLDVVFEAKQWAGTPKNMLPEEHGEIAWFSVDDLPEEKILDYHMAIIRGLANGQTYGEFNFPGRK